MTAVQRSPTESEHCAVTDTRPQVAGAMGALDGVSRAWESEESEMSAGEETTRRGSLPTMSTTRRGSRLQDILRYNQERKKKRDGKYKRDSQGFVWKRMPAMVYDEYTPAADSKPAALPPSPLITATVTPEQLAALAAAIAVESSGGVALPLPGGGLPKQYIQPQQQQQRPGHQLVNLAPGDQGLAGPNPQIPGGTTRTTKPIVEPSQRKTSEKRKISSRGTMDGAGGRGEPRLVGMDDSPLVYAQVEGSSRQYGRYDPTAPAPHQTHAAAAQLPNQQYPQHYQQQQHHPSCRPQQRQSRSGGRPSVVGGQYGDNGSSAVRTKSRRRLPPDPDSISLHSEHSYKSCSSEPEIPLVPRAVSDNYKYSGTASLERSAASIKALQQQRYSNALDAAVGTSAATSRSSSSATLATRQVASTSPVPPTPISGRTVSPQTSSGRTNIPQTPSVGRTTPGSGRATDPTTPGTGRPSGPPTPANSRSAR